MSASNHLSEVQFRPLREVAGMQSGDFRGSVGDTASKWVDDIPRRDANNHNKDGEELRRQRALTENIRTNGMKSPVHVREWPNGTQELQDGHHRVMAAMELGLKDVPVRVEQYGRLRRSRV